MDILGTRLNIRNATACPSRDEIGAAALVLSRFKVSIYQPLYANGFVEPGNQGGKFYVNYSVDHIGCIEVSVSPTWYRMKSDGQDAAAAQCYTFNTLTPDGVLEKVKLIEAAIIERKVRVDRRACCPLAVITACVCTISFGCPVHGSQCHGTHD